MTPPEVYVESYRDYSYKELVGVRDELLEYIKAFEEEKIPEVEWYICPGPDVRYQEYLEYTGLLCKMISEAYNREVVWKDTDEEDE